MQGYRLGELERACGAREKRYEPEESQAEVTKLIRTLGRSVKDARFIFLHVNSFLEKQPLPAEVGIAAFSIAEGIIDNFWTLIDPHLEEYNEKIKENIKIDSTKLALPNLPFAKEDQEEAAYFQDIVSKLDEFVSKYTLESRSVPMVFCLTREEKKVEGCVIWMYKKVGKVPFFKLYSMEKLTIEMSVLIRDILYEPNGKAASWKEEFAKSTERRCNYIFTQKNESYRRLDPMWRQRELLRQVRRSADSLMSMNPVEIHCHSGKTIKEDQFMYLAFKGIFFNPIQVDFIATFGKYFCKNTPSISCPYHATHTRGMLFCSLHTVNRHAYMIMEGFAEYLGVEIQELQQTPGKDKDEKAKRAKLLRGWEQYGYINDL